MSSRRKFLLVDAHALIYRAYYAIPGLSDPNGQLVNAVYGFSKMVLNAISYFEPEYAAVCFDHPKPTFRHKKFDGYKAQRAKMPDDLIPQIQIVKDVVSALGIPKFEMEGFEADDLIGTVNCKVEDLDKTLLTIIVTGDQDSFQLVDDDTHIWMPARGKQKGDIEYDASMVEKKLGIKPLQVIDLKALMGDNSDNIPGIKGVGPKTAAALIQKFETIEKIYEFLDQNPTGDSLIKGALLEKLLSGKESAFMSKDLATIECEAPIDFNLENCRVTSYDKNQIIEIFQRLGFKSLINSLPKDAFEASVQEALF
jgi:DNA polymerase-1